MQALYSLSQTASLYVPIVSVQNRLPHYVSPFDATSRWHTSALQLSAWESVTLPLRLKADQKGTSKASDYEATLSNDGKRKIVHLGLSVSEANKDDEATNGHVNGHHDERMPGRTNGQLEHEDEDGSGALSLDVDFTPDVLEDATGTAVRRRGPVIRSSKVFSQVQSLRGTFKSSLEIDDVNHGSRDRFSSVAAGGVRLSW